MTSRVASLTMARRSVKVGKRCVRCAPRRAVRKQFSTMMTAPSTMRPKSSAPKLIKIAGDARSHHAGDRAEHRDGNHGCGDERRAYIAQQSKQYGDDQQRAFCEIRRNRFDRGIDERRAIVDRRPRSRLPAATVQSPQASSAAARDRATVLADEHEYRAKHDLLPSWVAAPARNSCPSLTVCDLRQARSRRHACATTMSRRSSIGAELARRANQIL